MYLEMRHLQAQLQQKQPANSQIQQMRPQNQQMEQAQQQQQQSHRSNPSAANQQLNKK